eukprot:CAMPEP_0114113438 /NCGR_PEP_ID=MMETSP0043_2-20121206/2913_1 /TAXON_ID=464988 /ORGANISM="Hemiselmis andersenii, Strain CCMP644" /LENGTH=152 /DNA_ID=CAMNT_0001205589 /DNA_START=174 /DNA_END=632 /DNA_ORIENTATION=-
MPLPGDRPGERALSGLTVSKPVSLLAVSLLREGKDEVVGDSAVNPRGLCEGDTRRSAPGFALSPGDHELGSGLTSSAVCGLRAAPSPLAASDAPCCPPRRIPPSEVAGCLWSSSTKAMGEPGSTCAAFSALKPGRADIIRTGSTQAPHHPGD